MPSSSTMKSSSIADYILKLEKLNDESRLKIEQLKSLFADAHRERVAALEELGAIKNKSLYDSTARVTDKIVEVVNANNVDLANYLDLLGMNESNQYKSAAYRRAADTVAELPYEVLSGDDLLAMKGIGKGIASKVDEFIENQDPDYDLSDDEYDSDEESLVSDEEFETPNKDIYDMLMEYADNEPNRHKALVYERAADGVRDLTYRVTSGAALADGPQKVYGVGKKCAQLIDAYLKNSHKNNDKLAKCFLKLSNSENNKFKAAAYENAAEKLLKLNRVVTCGKDVKNLKGFGKSICSKIDSYMATEKC